MEVRKATSSQIQPQTDQKSEVSKTKNAVQKLISDSFEKENSKSSDSNSSSTASSEPEKKAGQITSGILVKQMTAARIGETNAKQSSEVSGKKDLSPEQQSRVSNSDPRKKNLDPSFFLQDARSKDEDRKNSGLQPPFATNNGFESSRLSKVDKDQVTNPSGSDQTSNAVKDANRLVDGGTLRRQFDAEVGGRKQDSNALGGSTSDRLNDLLNPTASGPQKNSQTGKDQMAYDTKSTVTYPDGGKTDSYDKTYTDETGTHVTHTEVTYGGGNQGIVEFYQTHTVYGNDNSVTVTEKEEFFQYDKDGNETKDTTTTKTTTTNADGSTHTETSTTTKQNGTTTTESQKTDTPAGGGAKSYDQENYTGNIPDEVKKSMDYFRQQVTSQKPSSGGETAHTDDSATADPTVGGRVSNLVAQQGSAGLLGNPGSADLQTGLGGAQSPVGSSQSGGNVDFGPDSDQVGYTGPTHEEDPGDVQFGPAKQPKAQTDAKKTEDADDSSTSNLDPLHKKRRDI